MTIEEYILQNRPVLRDHMSRFIQHHKKLLSALPHSAARLDELLEFVQGGKNLRGLQVLFAHDFLGGTVRNTALDVATAVELTHGAALIHDDMTDNDLVRHGKPSVYAAHMEYARTQSIRNPLLYGQSQALWVGDLGYFLSFELMKSVVSHQQGSRIMEQFARDIQLTCNAQLDEISYATSTTEPTEQEILDIYLYKTSRYSIVMPLTLGALLAGAADPLISLLEQFGNRVGIIFQMKDDEMGMFGDEKKTGKPIGSDIRENKKTLYRALLFQRVSAVERKQLDTIFGNETITAEDIRVVSGMINSYGIQQEIEKRLKKLEAETVSLLDSHKDHHEFIRLLHQFLQMNLKRTA